MDIKEARRKKILDGVFAKLFGARGVGGSYNFQKPKGGSDKFQKPKREFLQFRKTQGVFFKKMVVLFFNVKITVFAKIFERK